MRSKAFAEHVETNGIAEVFVINGGYKAFRSFALESFEIPEKLLILGGYTGSGKTHVLEKLADLGEQVIDLEGIANHKGSAFGAIGQDEQPINEHFTNLLYWEWRKMDFTKAIWLEDESIHIGKVYIPEKLFARMRDAQLYFLNIPKEIRGRLLVDEYVIIDRSLLVDAVNKISTRLGGLRTTEALEALEKNDYYETALITLDYYDKFYLKGLNRRDKNRVVIIDSEDSDPMKNAKRVLNEFRKSNNDLPE